MPPEYIALMGSYYTCLTEVPLLPCVVWQR